MASVVHVVAGSVWVGGLLALLAVVWLRRGDGHPVWELASRFSLLAFASLTVSAFMGLVLAISIIATPEDLLATNWGVILLVKTVLVVFSALIVGIWHRFVSLPALARTAQASFGVRASVEFGFRRLVLVESVLHVGVIIATMVLVASPI